MSMRTFLLFMLAMGTSCGPGSGGATVTILGGGLPVLRSGEHGLAVSETDIGYGTYEEAVAACDALILKGYDDWRLPERDELDAIYRELYLKEIGDLRDDTYWSSTVQDEHHHWARDFGNGRWKSDAITLEKNAFRAVRSY
ncbi:MAG: DUF1566 domain-containing protein [Bacteroidota bacterium]